jgi:hypothetical protein
MALFMGEVIIWIFLRCIRVFLELMSLVCLVNRYLLLMFRSIKDHGDHPKAINLMIMNLVRLVQPCRCLCLVIRTLVDERNRVIIIN